MPTQNNWISGKIKALPRFGAKNPDNAKIPSGAVDHEGPNNAVPNGTRMRFGTKPKKKPSHVKVKRY